MIRDRSGKSRGELETVAPEVLAMRARDLTRDNVSPVHAGDALAGFTLGRLLLRHRADRSDPGSITQRNTMPATIGPGSCARMRGSWATASAVPRRAS